MRAALERTFEIATLASQQRAVPAGGIVTMNAETKEAFTAIDDSIRGIVDGNLNLENRHCLPNESFMDDLLCLLAHQAKRYGSFPAARSFLSAASLVYRRTSEATPYFRDTDIENLIDQFNDGIDELQIAADYKSMEDWEPYRAREAERFAAAMKEREAVLGERGK